MITHPCLNVYSGLIKLCIKAVTKLSPSTRRAVTNNSCLDVSLPHDDVIKWKHFLRYWSFVRGFHRSLVNSPHKGQCRGVLMFSLIFAWINGWVNNGEAGDLRRHRTNYDVSVMLQTGVGGDRPCCFSYLHLHRDKPGDLLPEMAPKRHCRGCNGRSSLLPCHDSLQPKPHQVLIRLGPFC